MGGMHWAKSDGGTAVESPAETALHERVRCSKCGGFYTVTQAFASDAGTLCPDCAARMPVKRG